MVNISRLHHAPGGDALSRLVYCAQSSDVRHVLVHGRVLVEGGELRTLDEADVIRDATHELKRLLARV